MRRPGRHVAALVLLLPVSLAGCDPFCGDHAFDREIRFDAPVRPIAGPPEQSYEVYAIRVGDTATVAATAYETYFGDAGCHPAGPLAPPSSSAPARYSWSSSAPEVLTVDEEGRVHAVAEGEALLRVDAEGASGTVRVRVLPWFDAVRVTPTEATIAVSDTAGFLLEALTAAGDRVPGVNFRTAALMLHQPEASVGVAGNSIYSDLDGDPVRFVFIAIATGVVPLTARARVMGASEITADATLTVQ